MSQSAPQAPSLVSPLIGPVDVSLLAVVGRYFYLTATQLTRRCYAPSSQTYVQARLKRLSDAGYLQRIVLPRPSRTGSAPLVYTLARKGIKVLADWGRGVDRRYRPAEIRETSYLYLAHTLDLNDVLIALDLLCCWTPGLDLVAMRHERELKLDPVRVDLPDGRRVGVIPDAWVDLRFHDRYRECYAIELDRGTTERKAWQRKVAALVGFASGPYQEAFGTPSLTVVVVATPGERRRDQLVRWTAATLDALDRHDLADSFRFGVGDRDLTDVGGFFCQPNWWTPFADNPRPLLDLSLAPEDDADDAEQVGKVGDRR